MSLHCDCIVLRGSFQKAAIFVLEAVLRVSRLILLGLFGCFARGPRVSTSAGGAPAISHGHRGPTPNTQTLKPHHPQTQTTKYEALHPEDSTLWRAGLIWELPELRFPSISVLVSFEEAS